MLKCVNKFACTVEKCNSFDKSYSSRCSAMPSTNSSSTLESRMSASDIPKMDLLKINYVHQPKRLVVGTKSIPIATTTSEFETAFQLHQDYNAKHVYKYLALNRPSSYPNSPLNDQAIELLHPKTWDFLQNKRAIPTDNMIQSPECRHTSEIADYPSTTPESSYPTNGVEKSHSWNYRSKLVAAKKKGDLTRDHSDHHVGCNSKPTPPKPPPKPISSKSCSDVTKIQKIFESVSHQRNHITKSSSMDDQWLQNRHSRYDDSPRRKTFSPPGSDERIKRLDGPKCCECKSPRKAYSQSKIVSKIPQKIESKKRSFCSAGLNNPQKIDANIVSERKERATTRYKKFEGGSKTSTDSIQMHTDIKPPFESKSLPKSVVESSTAEKFTWRIKNSAHCEHTKSSETKVSEPRSQTDKSELISWKIKKFNDSRSEKEPPTKTNENINLQIRKIFQNPSDTSTSNVQYKSENVSTPDQTSECDLQSIIEAKMLRRRSDKRSGHNQSRMERVHIRKKRQPLLIINQLSESTKSYDQDDPTVDSKSDIYKQCENTTKPDDLNSDKCPQDHLVKEFNIKNLEKSSSAISEMIIQASPNTEKEKHSSLDHDLNDQITIVVNRSPHSDPNDVQNFSNKNLTKATTDELIASSVLNNTITIRSSPKAKISNADIENRKFNNLKNANHTPDHDRTDHNYRSPSTDNIRNSVKIFVCNSPVNSTSSSGDSNSLSDTDDRTTITQLIRPYEHEKIMICSRSVIPSSSSAADEERDNEEDIDRGDHCTGHLRKYQSDGGSNYSSSITVSSNTDVSCENSFEVTKFGCDGGIFWNNCYSYDGDRSNCICPKVIYNDDSCDCSTGHAINEHENGPNRHAYLHKSEQSKGNQKKTDVIHDLRPRSMDGVIDSGVSLNGDTGSSPDSEHMQNQQDSEARRLKRGHVLSELLETERIYVTEMSSILKSDILDMRYGGYDLRKATKTKRSFRLRKVQNTASTIVGKFNAKIGSFSRIRPICDSPLSFQGSLFEEKFDEAFKNHPINFSPSDFRPKLEAIDKNYVFGMNLINFSNGNMLSGKSSKVFSDMSLDSNSPHKMKDDRRTVFKELMDLSSCDESLEYNLIKDYLESNSYSDIENDTDFKDYLRRKNYEDILGYLEDRNSSTSTMRKNSLNNTKKLSNPKKLPDPNECFHLCATCKQRFRAWHCNDLKESREENTLASEVDKSKTLVKSYEKIYKFCLDFFEESFKDQHKKDLMEIDLPSYTEEKYLTILERFIVSHGYPTIASYVDSKFGSFLNLQLETFCNGRQQRTSRINDNFLLGYCDQMQSEEMMHLVPASLQGKEDILFGNLHELYTFHSEVFLKDLENCISTTELVALCFVQRRDTFYRLYSFYCQNIPRSDRLRETLVDTHLFLQECQKRLGHKLPLAAYLLKPVQRITKYQLLLKDLLRFSDSGSCTKELQKALDCMLIVLKCVNDSMHQIAITGFPSDLAQQGELLLQDSFQVWTESKRDIRLRIKSQQRHIFLYQKSMLFCKQTSKTGHNKSTYQFKHYVKMSQIGLTESVRGDPKRFEVWLQGRQEVHTLQAPTVDVKSKWVAEIKRVLLNQLEELKGEKIKQYGLNHRGLRQTTSWDLPNAIISTPQRTMSCEVSSESNRNSNCSSDEGCPPHTPGVSSISSTEKDNPDGSGWSSDYSNSEDEMSMIEDSSTPGSKFIALADYNAMGHSEVSMREGDAVELLKVGCAGWWFVRILDTNSEGWTPGAYLESVNRKSSRSSSRNQERIVHIN